jgi:hypothetical protein
LFVVVVVIGLQNISKKELVEYVRGELLRVENQINELQLMRQKLIEYLNKILREDNGEIQ